MGEISATVARLCAENGIELDAAAGERLEKYAEMLIEKNKVMNLTAITEPQEIALKHFYDSLIPLKQLDIPKGARVIDVGTGAGFPGMVLKIARPDIKLTLLDSLNKRLVFLQEVLDELGLEANIVHARAEEAARGELRESFDFAFARAVAQLNVLCEYCLPYVKVGGRFVAMKGRKAAEELADGKKAIQVLGGEMEAFIEDSLPGGDERGTVIIKKISQLSPKYPRAGGKISKSPIK